MRERRPVPMRTAAVAGAAVPLAFLVGRDGSPLWQTLRVLVVVSLAAAAIAVILRLRGGWRGWATRAVALLGCAVLFLALGIAVAATNIPPTGLGPETPADRGLAFEEAAFTTDDGATLSGWYVPSVNRAAVLLLHGAGSTRASR